jgi:predicted P-loop ATPase
MTAETKPNPKNRAAARLFCELIAGKDAILIFEAHAPKKDPRGKLFRRYAGRFADALPFLEAWETERLNIFVRPNGGPKREDVTEVRVISADFDVAGADHVKGQAVPKVWHVQPSVITRRGDSVRAHWLMRECPLERFAELEARMISHYGADPNARGLEHPWRPPGFKHPKYPDQAVELEVSLEADEGERYSVAEFEVGLPKIQAEPKESAEPAAASGDPVTESRLRTVLSFVDPVMSDEQQVWAGLAKAIRHGQLPVIADHGGEPLEESELENLLDDWCSGALWRKRTGDKSFEVPTYGNRGVLLERTKDRPREGGRVVTLGSFIERARRNGYTEASYSLIEVAQARGDDLPTSSQKNNSPPVEESNTKSPSALPAAVPDFTRTKDGDGPPAKTFKNALLAADALTVRPEFDEFAGKIVFREPAPWCSKASTDAPVEMTDDIVRDLRTRWLASYDLEASKDNATEALLAVAHKRRFHPVRDHLNSLVWDRRPRLDTWLTDYCRAEDSPYCRAVGRKFLVAAVARIFHPGVKFDTMLVFDSGQGENKSSATQILAVRPEWFTDALDMSGDKDAVMNLQGKWIAEAGELDGMRKVEINTVKAFLSRPVDRARFAYGRLTQDYPRQCVFIGTSNEGAYLRDATGGRRFWPVEVGRIDLDKLRRDRDQLYAEAVVAFRSGEGLVLPESLWGAAAEEQEARHAEHPWEGILRDYLDGGSPGGPVERVNRVHSHELHTGALGKHRAQVTQADSVQLRLIMTKRLGWFHRRKLRIAAKITSGFARPGVATEEGDV